MTGSYPAFGLLRCVQSPEAWRAYQPLACGVILREYACVSEKLLGFSAVDQAQCLVDWRVLVVDSAKHAILQKGYCWSQECTEAIGGPIVCAGSAGCHLETFSSLPHCGLMRIFGTNFFPVQAFWTTLMQLA